jgi:hypothetical protein
MSAKKVDGLKRFVKEYIRQQWILNKRPLTFHQAQEEYQGNGTLYFFERVTGTPKTTYQEPEMKTAQTHPLIADSNGEFPEIYIDCVNGYTVQLRNMNGRVLATYTMEPEENQFPMIH